MKKYWLIAPGDATQPSWKQVWDFDFREGLISIGWCGLGDVSKIDVRELEQKIKIQNPKAVGYIRNVFKNFYERMEIGDIVICRRGKKHIAGVGVVSGRAFFDSLKASATGIPEFDHQHFLPGNGETGSDITINTVLTLIPGFC